MELENGGVSLEGWGSASISSHAKKGEQMKEVDTQKRQAKHIFSELQKAQKALAASNIALDTVKRRRLDLLCKNFVLRADVMRLSRTTVLQRRIDDLDEQNAWLVAKVKQLQKRHVKLPRKTSSGAPVGLVGSGDRWFPEDDDGGEAGFEARLKHLTHPGATINDVVLESDIGVQTVAFHEEETRCFADTAEDGIGASDGSYPTSARGGRSESPRGAMLLRVKEQASQTRGDPTIGPVAELVRYMNSSPNYQPSVIKRLEDKAESALRKIIRDRSDEMAVTGSGSGNSTSASRSPAGIEMVMVTPPPEATPIHHFVSSDDRSRSASPSPSPDPTTSSHPTTVPPFPSTFTATRTTASGAPPPRPMSATVSKTVSLPATTTTNRPTSAVVSSTAGRKMPRPVSASTVISQTSTIASGVSDPSAARRRKVKCAVVTKPRAIPTPGLMVQGEKNTSEQVTANPFVAYRNRDDKIRSLQRTAMARSGLKIQPTGYNSYSVYTAPSPQEMAEDEDDEAVYDDGTSGELPKGHGADVTEGKHWIPTSYIIGGSGAVAAGHPVTPSQTATEDTGTTTLFSTSDGNVRRGTATTRPSSAPLLAHPTSSNHSVASAGGVSSGAMDGEAEEEDAPPDVPQHVVRVTNGMDGFKPSHLPAGTWRPVNRAKTG